MYVELFLWIIVTVRKIIIVSIVIWIDHPTIPPIKLLNFLLPSQVNVIVFGCKSNCVILCLAQLPRFSNAFFISIDFIIDIIHTQILPLNYLIIFKFNIKLFPNWILRSFKKITLYYKFILNPLIRFHF